MHHILEKFVNPNCAFYHENLIKWMHSMRQMYAKSYHQVWTTFGGMG